MTNLYLVRHGETAWSKSGQRQRGGAEREQVRAHRRRERCRPGAAACRKALEHLAFNHDLLAAEFEEVDLVRAQLLDDPRREFTPAELLGFAYAQPASFGPGGGFEYSNTNTIFTTPAKKKTEDYITGRYGEGGEQDEPQ